MVKYFLMQFQLLEGYEIVKVENFPILLYLMIRIYVRIYLIVLPLKLLYILLYKHNLRFLVNISEIL